MKQIKIEKVSPMSRFETAASHLGLMVVSLATACNVVAISDHMSHQIVSGLQPAFAAVSHDNAGSDEFRRGREEIRHTSASYGAFSRSHFTSGAA